MLRTCQSADRLLNLSFPALFTMEPPEAPLTLREKHSAERTRADLKMAENRERKDLKGIWRGQFLPSLITLGFWACGCFLAAYFFMWPLREVSRNNRESKDFYSKASTQFFNAEWDLAAQSLKSILDKSPTAPNANILLAKIHLAQGNVEPAIAALRMASRTTHNPVELNTWIRSLEAGHAPPATNNQ